VAGLRARFLISQLLEKYLRDWLRKQYKPNEANYLFVNSSGKPYRSDSVIRVLHRIVAKLGIQEPKGVHVGIPNGVTTERRYKVHASRRFRGAR